MISVCNYYPANFQVQDKNIYEEQTGKSKDQALKDTSILHVYKNVGTSTCHVIQNPNITDTSPIFNSLCPYQCSGNGRCEGGKILFQINIGCGAKFYPNLLPLSMINDEYVKVIAVISQSNGPVV